MAHGGGGRGHLSAAPALAWGVVRRDEGAPPAPALRAGERVVLLGALADAGLLDDDPSLRDPVLNALIERGPAVWRAVLSRVRELLTDGRVPDGALVALGACEPVLPVRVPDFVDCYASLEHATNLGRIFRPGQPALAPNWRHLPVAYHGRSSTVVVSGTLVRRPLGQVPDADGVPRLQPTAQLDLECELGLVCGPSTRPGERVPVDEAEERIFGVVIVNDWSARDIQRFEYVPLGPFLGKSFATSMSAWITPLDAVSRAPARDQDPLPPDYLRPAGERRALDVSLEVEINGTVVSRPPARALYWTPAQLIAHVTVNGAALSAGDLIATGTISGGDPGTEGSLPELMHTAGGAWLADGDEVVLRARSGDAALGEVRGRVLPAAP